jgi:hypothetical protein
LHPLLHAGLSRRTVNYFFSLTTISSSYQRQLLSTLGRSVAPAGSRVVF